MLENEIKQRLCAAIELETVHVSAQGSHFQVIAVGDVFAHLTRVQCQQLIYKPLNDLIKSDAIHALTIKTFTPEKWQRERHFFHVSS